MDIQATLRTPPGINSILCDIYEATLPELERIQFNYCGSVSNGNSCPGSIS